MATPVFQPLDPDFARRCRDSFGRQGFMVLIGARMTRIEPGICEIELPARPEVAQQHGYVHGGALASIADSAAGYAAYSLMPRDSAPLTVEYKLNILRPAAGERVLARALVLKPGRTLHVVRADVFALAGGSETLCVASLQTLMRLDGRADTPPRDGSAGAGAVV
jgi:uncharacterized protein (TIGR00369 family)